MRKRSLLSFILGLIFAISQFIICIFLVAFLKDGFFSSFLLMTISLGIIILVIFSYFIHDRIFGFINIVFTLIAFINLPILLFFIDKDNSTLDYLFIFLEVSLVGILISIIFSIYRLKLNQTEFDNHLFDCFNGNKRISISLFIVKFCLLLIILIYVLKVKHMPITLFTIICSLVLLSIGQIIKFRINKIIGSLLIMVSTISLLFGTNPIEYGHNMIMIILMIITFIISILLSLSLVVVIKKGQDVLISPKEYKK